MANIATVRDSLRNARTLKKAHTAATVVGEVVVINGQVCVACNAKDADTDNAFVFRGRVEFDKKAATALTAGQKVYWDDTNKEITDLDGGGANPEAGIMVEDAAAADATALVMLGENK